MNNIFKRSEIFMLNKNIKNVIFILVFVMLLGVMIYQFLPQNKPQAKADSAIDFKLMSIDGKQYSISEFRDKKVVLNFFATWCPPCKAEIPDFQRFHENNKDVVLVGIDVQEDAPTVKEFIQAMGVTYTILLDSDGRIASNFGIQGIPTTFLIDENGKLVNKNVGMMNYSQLESFVKQK